MNNICMQSLTFAVDLVPLVYTLVPGTWYTSTRYCCVYFVFQGATFFTASYSYGNFLSAGLGSSPIYSSIDNICVQSLTFAVCLV